MINASGYLLRRISLLLIQALVNASWLTTPWRLPVTDHTPAQGAVAQDDVDTNVNVVVTGLDAIDTTVPTPLDGQVRGMMPFDAVPTMVKPLP